MTTDDSTASGDFTALRDFIVDLFCRVDDAMSDVPRHSQAKLFPSELVTLGLLFALRGRGGRAFDRWAKGNLRGFFPGLPHRTRLMRLLAAHKDWTRRFLAEPTLIGVADSYGIELIHPRREGRTDGQIGKKGKSNLRWIVGAKVCLVLNRFGLVCDWATDTANVADKAFHPLIERFGPEAGPDRQMLVLADSGFHAKSGDPANMKVCPRGTWNDRMVIETVHSMLTGTCQIKKVAHRAWDYLNARLAFCLAAFNLLAQWDGLTPDENGFIPLALAKFSL
jgi:hypothetical protein